MASPKRLLETYAAALDASGGDSSPIEDAIYVLEGLATTTPQAVSRRLNSMARQLAAKERSPGSLAPIARALAPLLELLRASGTAPAWLAAYIDILARTDAKSAEDLRQRLQKTSRAAGKRQHRTEPMSPNTEDAVAARLAAAIKEEALSRDAAGGALAALESNDLTKDTAVAVAFALSGINYRTKKAAIDGIRSWYSNRRYSRRSMEKVAEASRRL